MRGTRFLTYRGENGPWETDDGEAAQAVFNGGGDGVRQCSGSKDSSGDDGVGGGSSSKRLCVSAMTARVWAKFAWDRALFIGVLDRIVDNKNTNTFLV
jgi:hypothetical protein